MITNNNWANKAIRRSLALVSGDAFTECEWQEFDELDTLEPNVSPRECKRRARLNLPPHGGRLISDQEWAAIERCSRWLMSGNWRRIRDEERHGHHAYQHAAKRFLKSLGKDPGNFTAIASSESARYFRLTLELARLCAISMRNEIRGSVVDTEIYPKYLLNHLIQEYEDQTNFKPLIAPTFDKLTPQMKRILKIAGMSSKTGMYTAVSLNFGKKTLDKFMGKANGRRAWHKRMTTALNKALRGLPFSFAMERAGGDWHLHMIVYGVHFETFEEQYKAALLQVGGDYTKAAEDHQLVIEGGYGFEGMLGWVGYLTKAKDAILYESHELTAAGRQLFTYVGVKLALISAFKPIKYALGQ